MTLVHILVFTLFSWLVGWLFPVRYKTTLLLFASIIAVYWLQPSSPIRNLDFWLPTASIALTIATWAITQPRQSEQRRFNLAIAGATLGLILAIALTRYVDPLCCLTPTRPPELHWVILSILFISGITLLLYLITPSNQALAWGGIVVIILIFVILKYEPLSASASAGLRALNQQNPALAAPLDILWLGFSYLAFRLIHTLRDFQANRLPEYRLDEFITYALFYPALTAGPIDRSQRFIQKDLPAPALRPDRIQAIERILIGVFKKFVVADSLALISLNPVLVGQVNSSFWLWVLLYAYALRIYFDFSGYTDIAIGIGRFVGIQLPENFSNPYLKSNLTSFWNSWHITLAQWFRSYVFNPLTRSLRMSPRQIPAWAIILIGQTITMLLIGLWHGITWSFAIWGLWHALGLFVHNRWSEWSRPRLSGYGGWKTSQRRALAFGGWLLTYNYVVLGWVWFIFPQPEQAIDTFRKLFGG